MSGDEVDIRKRRFLTAAATVVGGVGAAYAAVPFLASWLPSERAKAAGAPVQADISKLEAGQMIRVQWRGKPVWVVRRTEEMLAALPGLNSELRDPESVDPQQPEVSISPAACSRACRHRLISKYHRTNTSATR